MTDAEQKQLIKEFERGHRVAQLLRQPGYQDLLAIFEAEVQKNEFRLMNLPLGSPIDLLRDMQVAARVSRSLFEQIQIQLVGVIAVTEDAVTLARPQSDYDTQYNNL